MKIAIPVVDLIENRNCISDGLSFLGQLCIHDNRTNESAWIKTSELAENMGELLSALEKKSVTEIITSKIQPMALQVLTNKGFHVYQSNGFGLDENILAYNQHALPPFDRNVALSFAQICGGVCDSCKTDCEADKQTEEQ